MLDTLHNGEILLVTKFDYGSFWATVPFQASDVQESSTRLTFGTSDIKRSDVVIVRYPAQGITNFVKRVVGLPGDHIALKDGLLYVNGELYDEPYIADEYRVNHSEYDDEFFDYLDNMDAFIVPKSGDVVTFVEDQSDSGLVELLVNGHSWYWYGIASDMIAENGDVLRVTSDTIFLNDVDILANDQLSDLVGREFVIKDDLYFVMGDHRNNSSDSRVIGPVNRSDIIGHVRHVVFPFDVWRSVN